jgi:hypothetical protein
MYRQKYGLGSFVTNTLVKNNTNYDPNMSVYEKYRYYLDGLQNPNVNPVFQSPVVQSNLSTQNDQINQGGGEGMGDDGGQIGDGSNLGIDFGFKDVLGIAAFGPGYLAGKGIKSLYDNAVSTTTFGNMFGFGPKGKDKFGKSVNVGDVEIDMPTTITPTNLNDYGGGPGSNSTDVGGTGTAAAADTSQGETGYGSCFIAGTKITMADGTTKNIENIKIGDIVKGHKDNNEVIKLDPTLLGERKLYSFNDNEHYFFTSEHPFMTEEGWKSIKPEKTKERDGIELYNQLEGELKIGDKLVTEKGLIEIKEIKSKEMNDPKMPLYNFNVSNDNSYMADGYVVHNKGGGGGTGGGTYVCTASYDNNLITTLDFKTLKKYGIKLRRNDKYLMKAYDWFGPKLAAMVKKGKLVNFAKHSTSMWKYDQTKQKDIPFKIKLIIKIHKLFTRPIIRMLGVLLIIKEKIKNDF